VPKISDKPNLRGASTGRSSGNGLVRTSFLYLGIDPGASGGAAVIGGGGKVVACVGWSNKSLKDIWSWISCWKDTAAKGVHEEVFAVIEKVQGYIGGGEGKGGGAANGSAMFKFGQSSGALQMALTAAGIPYEEYTPQAWQKGLEIPRRGKGESKTEWKRRLKARAEKLFPQQTVTLQTADALLLSEFCRRKRTGQIK
jgi:Holliday junction resolvasome RuvABC endonuclease subunit